MRSTIDRKLEEARGRQRAMLEVLLERARVLAPRDRTLLWAIYRYGMSPPEIEAAFAIPRRSVNRRARTLIKRLSSPDFLYVLRHRHGWPDRRRRVGELAVLQGRTLRETAARLRTSLHHVRREILWIRLCADLQTEAERYLTSHDEVSAGCA